MHTLIAPVPCEMPPTWAILERRLIDLMNASVYPFLERYTRPGGTLIWHEDGAGSRDGADDFYDSSYIRPCARTRCTSIPIKAGRANIHLWRL
jgi:hypothetical protein